MEFNLNGGVLIIGSLYWQDHLVKKGDNIRDDWRKQRLEKDSAFDVPVPIRYGRFSREHSYTMVFDLNLSSDKYGIGKFTPFQRATRNWEDLKEEVRLLSLAEGMGGDFIASKTAWAACGMLLNPKIEKHFKVSLLSKWNDRFQRYKGYSIIVDDPNLFAMDLNGNFTFPWPKELDNYDFLIAASTQPRLRKGVKVLTVEEIANHVKNREYFYPNRKHGITTHQDEEIINILNAKQ